MNLNKFYLEDVKISYICQSQYEYFLNKKNVVGIALGYKITKGFCTFKKCITVFVKKKLPLYKLCKNELIPNFFKGFITDVIESGILKSEALKTKVRPVINGYSIGNGTRCNFGTAGCLVEDKYLYILSCNHVLAINNIAPLDSPILQPGVEDRGKIEKDVIGQLSRFIPIKFITEGLRPENEVDCALCKVISRSFVSPEIAFIGIPHGIAKPKLNEDVKKVGRTTELTTGKVTHIHGTLTIRCQTVAKDALFINQIVTTKMSNSGDSGSLLLNNNNYGIGLCTGSSDKVTIANEIDIVLNSLKVKLVTK